MPTERTYPLSPMQLLILEHGAIGSKWGGDWQCMGLRGVEVGVAARGLLQRRYARVADTPDGGGHAVLVATALGVDAMRLETRRGEDAW